MGKASSAKKVARAARAGESTTTSERRELGFPAIVAGVIILGLLLVAFARQSRDAEVRPALADHWHMAYSVFDCTTGSYQGAWQSEFDPEGIHSHQDSVIHIHPFSASVTGSRATMGVFFEAMFTDMTTESLSTSGGSTLTAGVDCDGEPAILQVHKWDNVFDPGDPEVFTDNFDDIRLDSDGGGFVIALAPVGAELTVNPEAVAALERTMGSDRESTGRNTTAIPDAQGPSDFGEDTARVDGAGEDNSLDLGDTTELPEPDGVDTEEGTDAEGTDTDG